MKDKLQQSINVIDIVTEKRVEQAAEQHHAVRDARTAAKVHDMIEEAGDELLEALAQIGLHVERANKVGLLSYALKTADSVVLYSIISEAIRADLTEQVEDD